MSWLKKIGQVLGVVTQVVVGFGPIFAKLTPSTKDDVVVEKAIDSLGHLTGILVTVEAIGVALGLTGPDKLKAAVPLVAQLILQSDAMVGHKIDNPSEFQAGVADLVSAWVRIQNSTKADIKTVDKT